MEDNGNCIGEVARKKIGPMHFRNAYIQQLLLLLFLSWDYEVKKILVSLGVGRIGTQGTVLKINKSHCAGGTHCFLLVTTTIASFFIWPVRDAENVRRKHHGKCVKCAVRGDCTRDSGFNSGSRFAGDD